MLYRFDRNVLNYNDNTACMINLQGDASLVNCLQNILASVV